MKRNYYETEAGEMPVTLAEIKHNLGIELDDDSQDIVLTIHLGTAVKYCEEYCNRIFKVGSTIEFSLPYLARFIDLPKYLNEVESIQYYDTDNELVTIGAEDYCVIKSSFNSSWVELFGSLPTTHERSNAVLITLTSGACPNSIKGAIHLKVEELYEGADNEKRIRDILNIESNPFI